MKYDTLCLHGSGKRQNPEGATQPPVYFSNAFEHGTAEELARINNNQMPGYSYTRIANPTVTAFEERITRLEGGIGLVAVASGMAAVYNALAGCLSAGDAVIASAGLYGGTIELFRELENLGIQVIYADRITAGTIEALDDGRIKAVFAETIGNPRLDVLDMDGVAQAAHARGMLLMVDNTTATSWVIRPLEHGADVVAQSGSKYINGSGSAISGVITAGGHMAWDPARFPRLAPYRKFGPYAYLARLRDGLYRSGGACLSPQNAFMNCVGLETLGLRMARICGNALELARWLEKQPAVAAVHYPGLTSSPWHETAAARFKNGYGGVLTFQTGSQERAFAVVDGLRLALKVNNFGDSKTLVCHPGSSVFAHNTPEEKAAAGVSDDLIRVSVGIEDIEDIIADFRQALGAVGPLTSE